MRALLFGLCLILAAPAVAQDRDQTLADIRQDLTVLYVEIQTLKRELSTTGAPQAAALPQGVLDRVNAIESELTRLTAQTEELQLRVDRIVKDGTNRIGDLEFRLCELEANCEISGEPTSTLGGEDADVGTAVITPATPSQTDQGELAVGERADFDAASQALADGDYQTAADLFAQFDANYPGSPLAPEANLKRGHALEGLGDTREAARAFLASFTGDSEGAFAPEALFELGAALGRLGQTDQACITLNEVGVRFPSAPAFASATQAMSALGCP